MTREDIDQAFKFVSPSDRALERMSRVREEAKSLSNSLLQTCPDSRARSLALTHIQEGYLWAMKALEDL